MCITLEPAKLSSTRIYAGDVTHPSGRPVHVIGYQNVVQTPREPNAMFSPNVTGQKFQAETRNGDFALSAKALRGSVEAAVKARTQVLAPPSGGAWGL